MRNKRQEKLFSLGRFIILALIFMLLSISAFNLWQKRLWDGESRFTIALNADPVTIFSIEPTSHKAVLITIPSNTIFDVPYGYGDYLASSIFRLGALDKKRGGGVLFSKSVENSLGIMVDGYVSLKQETLSFPLKTAEDIRLVKSNYFSYIKLPAILWGALTPTYETNLSFLDLIALFFKIKSLRSDQIELINIGELSLLSDRKLPDGAEVKIIDDEIFDSALNDNFQDISIRKELVSFQVVNATDKDQLATQIGRILKNSGINVVSKTTAPKTESYLCKLKIFEKKALSSLVVRKVAGHYNCQIEDNSNKSEAGETNTADVKLFLGEGFIQ